MNVKCIWPGPASLGECPLWHVAEQALYWVDIEEQCLYRLDSSDNRLQQWNMPGQIGCIAPRAKGGLIAGIDDTICFIDLPSGKVTTQLALKTGIRLNDGKCDRQGRFWVGTIDFDNPTACLYRYDPDGKLHVMEKNIYISNGLAWSLDNKFFYYTDSVPRNIFRYDFDARSGEISNQRVFATNAEDEGIPDGLTIDSEGHLWSARYDGGFITRYAPDGTIAQRVTLPVQRPTSCMFGGKNLDVLFVTSSSRLLKEPKALPLPNGGLYAIDVGVRGVPEPAFLES